MSQITLTGVSRAFGKVGVLHDINLDILDGELIVFVGPSGCGKSTLLRLIAGLDRPTGGVIAIDGKDVTTVPAADRGLAMVFQSYALYPHMSVRQNLAFGLENARMARAEIDARIAEAARMLEIAPYLDRRPGQLSGGQRQRVAIGRAIVRNPTAFLLDEPLSNLDAELRISTRAELAALHERLSATMVYVTHDQIEAMTLADRIVVLRAGRIEQIGTPLDLYNHPANLFVAGFIGAPRMNFLPVKVAPGGTGRSSLTLDGSDGFEIDGNVSAANGDVTLGLRPHHIGLADAGKGDVAARVALVEALGSETIVHTRTSGGQTMLAVVAGQCPVASGDTVDLKFDTSHLHLFDGTGVRIAVS
ncbi:MAG: sn-glycerol-3-phosphate ABC transporter ATP-binding protein UgpC [Mesorhizobium sp.]|uniref:ABC transporter ATP-binding protein n=1 Tax=Mesorhizobium sp. TaxID=1871066 RepID=UPI0012288327|nr:sn-glycerol-3-phosphate ABC transporter ATP-binding protein UgpC [Mesorhizobium sp.]TIL75702.1 MAG: sn-glycerol-3-phosphate ABC transporter ATP-binding protein UgpC [Mesorhizobium sp.]TIL90613.1 MAG: sn-glycerol-3-phosphate ABC transporter ATP-binding protein UgpC [Mesorhizobium sp.]TIM03339.1 MAG: sn-glycerol-3-phosphate ABC transporter ATP-binding protein UgpC [Mesorhizobium sp.]